MTARAIAFIGLLALASGCDSADTAEASAEVPAERQTLASGATRVEVATIRPSEASLDLRLPGEVEASRDANLSAPLGGYVEKVSVESGDEVRKGQILALIDSATHGAKLAQAQVEVDTAKRELERQKMLGDAAPRASLEAAQARYDAARAAYRSANVSLGRSVIKAPFAGVMATVDVEVGETAAPGATLMRLVQLDPIEVNVSLSDRAVMSVRSGMKAKVTTDARGTMLEGEVKLVQPTADTKTRSFVAEVQVENAERLLLPGMIANVQLKAEVAEDQLIISQDWLVTKPTSLGVFVHEEGVARWRPVKVGPIVGDRVVLLEGLTSGDELVIRGHRELADGDRLIIARQGVCCVEGRVDFGATKAVESEE